jgi:hypothetical protein
LVFDQDALLARRGIDQPILPFVGIAVLSDRRIERGVPAEPTVHVDYVVLGDAEAFGEEFDLIRAGQAKSDRRIVGSINLTKAIVIEGMLLGGGAVFPMLRSGNITLSRVGVGIGEPPFVVLLLIEIHSLPVSLKAVRLPKMRSRKADFLFSENLLF